MPYHLNNFRRLFCRQSTYSTRLIIGLSCLCFGLFNPLPLHFNFTDSMPPGVYWETQDKPHVGDWVTVCLPDKLAQFGLQKGYLQVGRCSNRVEPLFKQVVGMAGDIIVLDNHLVLVNGVFLPHSTTLPFDTRHRPLPAIPRGVYVLKSKEVWLFGIGSPQSWDSRYFGAVDASCVKGVVKPLLTLHRNKQP